MRAVACTTFLLAHRARKINQIFSAVGGARQRKGRVLARRGRAGAMGRAVEVMQAVLYLIGNRRRGVA
ncbi:MAG: hypothetical protein A3A88_11410 [Nitrospirae bacterium RIFCSPLOWO2_01_FULL_62_17]|nr:MAG: hypothetical protein A3A88_11410 [Nitrospirae bacterium RIFCSPLOWO2_01_FULL_62_17]